MTKSERIKILEIQVEALQKQVKELQASGRWWNTQPHDLQQASPWWGIYQPYTLS